MNLILTLYQAYFNFISSFGSYEASALAGAATVGVPVAIAILFAGLPSCLPPPTQFMHTINFISKGNMSDRKQKRNKKAIESLEAIEEKQFKDEQFKEWVEISYRRLGKTAIYENYLATISGYKRYSLIVGATFALCGVALNNTMLILIGVLFGMLFYVMAESLCEMMLKSSISALNAKQRIELPILISRFIAVTPSINAYPLNKVLETYLQHAGSLKYDIEMTLSDIKNYGDMKALTQWQKRATLRQSTNMIEFTTFCEKIKKLYSQGDELYVRTELSALQKTVDEKYTLPLIQKKSQSKLLKLMILMMISFAILAGFMMLPMIIEIAGALAAAQF